MPPFSGLLTYPDGTPLLPGPLTLYTHVSDAGVVRHWHIDKMLTMVPSLEVIAAPVEADFVPVIRARRGIEKHRLDRLCPHDLMTPLIFVEFLAEGPDDPPVSHLLVDGNHRYVKASQIGWDTLPAVIFPHDLSETCRVMGLPDLSQDHVLTMQSGIA